MSEMPEAAASEETGLAKKIAYGMALAMVIVGIVNSMPSIPGLDDLIRSLVNNDKLSVRRFPPEWFYPLVFHG